MRLAGRKAYLVLRSGKWDIPYLEMARFGHEPDLIMRLPFGVPYVRSSLSICAKCVVALGFPDILSA